jgi:hypothetical protein
LRQTIARDDESVRGEDGVSTKVARARRSAYLRTCGRFVGAVLAPA